MKQQLLLAFLFLLSIQTFGQDNKWSVEANYAVVPDDGFGQNDNLIDLGLKYRFVDFNFVNVGLSFNGGFSKETFDNPEIDGNIKSYYFQPRIFSEFTIPGINRLQPSVGLGYSFVNADSSVISIGEDIGSNTTNRGFNLNIGLSYYISKRFFIQAQYDFIGLKVRDEFEFQGEVVQPDFTDKLNNIKIGLGFRF